MSEKEIKRDPSYHRTLANTRPIDAVRIFFLLTNFSVGLRIFLTELHKKIRSPTGKFINRKKNPYRINRATSTYTSTLHHATNEKQHGHDMKYCYK